MATHLTPNIGLKESDFKDSRWDDELRDSFDILDAVIGMVTAVGNYDVLLRPSLSAIIGSEAGLGKSVLQALLDNQTELDTHDAEITALQAAITPSGLNAYDTNTIKLNSAATYAEALNMLDGVLYEEANPSQASVLKMPPLNIADAILTLSPTAGPNTPVGIGILRWHQSRSSLGVQFFDQTAEGNEIHITGNGIFTVYGHDGVGSITLTVVDFVTLSGMPDTDQQFSLSSTIIFLSDNVLDYLGRYCCVVLDDSNPLVPIWHIADAPSEYNFAALTVTNDGAGVGYAKIQTNAGGGFPNGSKVFYVSIKGQDTTAQAYLGWFDSMLDYWAMFKTGTINTGVFTSGFTSLKDAIERIDTLGVHGGPWTLAIDQLVASDVTLNFGAVVGESIKWSQSETRFKLSKGTWIDGRIEGTNDLLVATGVTTTAGDVLAQAGNVIAGLGVTAQMGDITATVGDLVASAGNLSVFGTGGIGGDLTVDGNIILPTVGATVDGYDLDDFNALLTDPWTIRDTGTRAGKEGTTFDSWQIGYLTRMEQIELVAGIDWNFFTLPPYNLPLLGLPKIRYRIFDQGGGIYAARWEYSDDGLNFNFFNPPPPAVPNLSQVLSVGNSAGLNDIDITGQSMLNALNYQFLDSTFVGTLQVATLTGPQSWTLPNNTGTIALLSDIPSAPTLDAVLGAGNTATNKDMILLEAGGVNNIFATNELAKTITIGSVLQNYDLEMYGNINLHSAITGITSIVGTGILDAIVVGDPIGLGSDVWYVDASKMFGVTDTSVAGNCVVYMWANQNFGAPNALGAIGILPPGPPIGQAPVSLVLDVTSGKSLISLGGDYGGTPYNSQLIMMNGLGQIVFDANSNMSSLDVGSSSATILSRFYGEVRSLHPTETFTVGSVNYNAIHLSKDVGAAQKVVFRAESATNTVFIGANDPAVNNMTLNLWGTIEFGGGGSVSISRDLSNNLVFKDAVAGSKTLSDLVGGGSSTIQIDLSADGDIETFLAPAGEYGCAWDYTVYRLDVPGSVRAGRITTCWYVGGGTSKYSDARTTDIGDTTPIDIYGWLTGGNIALHAVITAGTWRIRAKRTII